MSAPEKTRVRRAFSRRPPPPDIIAAERLWARVSDMAQTPAVAADIGGGGEFIAARYPAARVIALDFALPVLRASSASRARKIVADAEHLPLADAAADLIWSNLCAEWMDARLFFAEAARVLKPGGLFAFTTLGAETLREMRAVFAGEARVHAFADMHNIGDALQAGGFAEPLVESDRLRFTYADAPAALADMRNAGAACALAAQPRGLMGKARWRRACADYAARYTGADGRVYATIELIIATAWRRAPADAADAETPVRFYR